MSTIIVILIIVVLFIIFNFYLSKKKDIVLIIADAIMIIPVIITYLFAPELYIVDNEVIQIKKHYGDITINRKDIKKISQISVNELSGIYRKFASGGLFGYFGKFATKKFNELDVYAGSLSHNLILIEMNNGKKYLITPKEIELFIKTIEKSKAE